MSTSLQLIESIAAECPAEPLRIMNLSAAQERVVTLSSLRANLPDKVQLVTGPGCVASICPVQDLHQARRLVEHHRVTLIVSENLFRLPMAQSEGPASLAAMQAKGADIRPVSSPMEAVMLAVSEPQREMVYLGAGFETFLAPLAGMVLEGLPANLKLMVCGRRVEPLLTRLFENAGGNVQALILPGNRCAVTGIRGWEAMARRFEIPAAVCGYTATSILTGILGLIRQVTLGQANVDNHYRALVKPDGNAMALDQMDRVFELHDGLWRGIGTLSDSAWRLRHTYAVVDAYNHYPDYRDECPTQLDDVPAGCEFVDVELGCKSPEQCAQFFKTCTPAMPVGPSMASDDGACYLRGSERAAI